MDSAAPSGLTRPGILKKVRKFAGKPAKRPAAKILRSVGAQTIVSYNNCARGGPPPPTTFKQQQTVMPKGPPPPSGRPIVFVPKGPPPPLPIREGPGQEQTAMPKGPPPPSGRPIVFVPKGPPPSTPLPIREDPGRSWKELHLRQGTLHQAAVPDTDACRILTLDNQGGASAMYGKVVHVFACSIPRTLVCCLLFRVPCRSRSRSRATGLVRRKRFV